MIEDYFFLILWVLLPIFWQKMLKVAGINMLRISIPSILMIGIYVYQYIGFPILYFGLDNYRSYYVQDKAIMLIVFAYSSITITLLLLGFIAAKKYFGSLHGRYSYNAFDQTVESANSLERFVIVLLFVISSLVLFRYFQIIGLNNIALFSALGFIDTGLTSEKLRSLMGNEFAGKYHWYKLFMRDLLSIAVFASFALYLTKPKASHLIMFSLFFLVASVSMLAATEKAPFLWLLIGVFFTYIIAKKNGLISKLYFFTGIAGLFLLMGISFWLFKGSSDIVTGVQHAFSRLFSGQMQGLYHYVELFPKQMDYLYGLSFPNPGGLLPYTPVQLTVEVMHTVMPQLSERGVVGSMPTFFWGEMYANFGFSGVLLPPFIIGFLLYWFNIFLMRTRVTPTTIALIVWASLHFKDLAGASLSVFIVDIYLWVIMVIVMAGLFVAGRGAIRLRYRYRNEK